MKYLTTILLLALCATLQAVSLSPVQYQSAHVLKQSTIQMQSALASVQTHIVTFTDSATNATGGLVTVIDPDSVSTNLFPAIATGTNFTATFPILSIPTNDWQDCRVLACVTNATEISPMSFPYYVTALLTNSIFNLGFANEYPVARWSTNHLSDMLELFKLDTNGIYQITKVLPPNWNQFVPQIKAASPASVPTNWIVNQYDP